MTSNQRLQGWQTTLFLTVIFLSHYSLFKRCIHASAEDIRLDKIASEDLLVTMIPIWVIMMVAEAVLIKRSRFGDCLTSIFHGLLLKTLQTNLRMSLVIGPYLYIWHHYSVTHAFDQPNCSNSFLVLMIVDFAFYWIHRTGHTISVFWAMHGVHHASEDFNLSTGFRLSLFKPFLDWILFLPLALFFSPHLFVYQQQFHYIYQFWVHTEIVGKLGPLEWFFSTPSQHRVHHGKKDYCIDTNFGAFTCIYDRLFGTFQEEKDDDPPTYGLTQSPNTFCAIHLNFVIWQEIIQKLPYCHNWADRFRCFFGSPGWLPPSLSKPHYASSFSPSSKKSSSAATKTTAKTLRKYDPRYSKSLGRYILFQGFSLMLFFFLFTQPGWGSAWSFSYLYLNFFSMGRLLNKSHLAILTEILKHLILAFLVQQNFSELNTWIISISIVYLTVSLGWVVTLRPDTLHPA